LGYLMWGFSDLDFKLVFLFLVFTGTPCRDFPEI